MKFLDRICDAVMMPFNSLGSWMFRQRSPRLPELLLQADGFAVQHQGRLVDQCAWNDVDVIVAFKRDLVTVDEICLQIEMRSPARVLEISEDYGGFVAFIKAIEENLPGVRANWWCEVAFPAFAENATFIFDRHSSNSDKAHSQSAGSSQPTSPDTAPAAG